MKESRSAKKPVAAREAEPTVEPLSELDVPEDGGIRLALPGFEGPLDLLLHLIQEHELDILNIPIAFITQKYLEYIGLMQELNIDVASEYLVMAATLAHIKSRMLLPTPPADLEEGEEDELDPRAELIRRLLEYQKYKKAGEELASRSVLGRDIFVRGVQPALDATTAPLAPVNSFKLLEAFQRVLTRAKISIDHQIEFERFSLSDRINQLVDLLKGRGRVVFDELFEGQRSRGDLIVTFLALLELTRLRMTRLFQEGSLEPIFIELAVLDDEDPNVASEGAQPGAAGDAEPAPAVTNPEDGAPRPVGPATGGVGTEGMPESEDDELDDELDDFDLAALDLDEEEFDGDESASPRVDSEHSTDAAPVSDVDALPVDEQNATSDAERTGSIESSPKPTASELGETESDEQAIIDELDAVLTAETPPKVDPDESPSAMPGRDTILVDDAISSSADSELELK